jgi:hypothetical protein
MIIRPSVDMMEALRLTRQGRLEEAMAVLRGAAPAARRPLSAKRMRGPFSTWCRPRWRPEAPGQRRQPAQHPTRRNGETLARGSRRCPVDF